MTIWSNIKSFLNSKLGKEEFEPLDEMMVSGWKLRPSKHSIYYAISGTITYDYEQLSEGFIIDNVRIDGEIRKTFKAYGDGEITVDFKGTIQIYKNDVEIYSAQGNKQQNISFVAGDVLTFVFNTIGELLNKGYLIIYGEEYKDDYFIK